MNTEKARKHTRVLLVTYAPQTHAERVRRAMGEVGAGRLGRYTHCSFSARGVGRFKGGRGAKPAVGKAGRFEEVPEERIEMVCARRLIKKVVSAIKRAHPYEEIPIYILPLERVD